jgi:chitodextrinase
MTSTFEKCSFTIGEISQRAFGRFDQTKPIYRDGAAILENFLISQHGPAFYRPGSQYVATAGQVAPVRLEPFAYSISQSYILEFGKQYLNFYSNGGSIASQIATPYLQADLFNLQFAGKQDVSYIANPNYPPYKLIRTSATSFIIQKVQFLGGPFLDSNVSDVTITPSSDTGTTTLTATIPAWATTTQYVPGDFVTHGGSTYLCQLTHISGTFATDLTNNDWVLGAIFKTGHVGSIWQINNTVGALQWTANASYPVGFIVYFNGVTYKCLVANTSSSSFLADLAAGDWQVFGGTVLITGYTSATVVTGVVQGSADGTVGNLGMAGQPTTVWAEGAWSDVRGWPTCCCFHEDRLVFANTTYQPNTFWGSAVGGYENFSPGGTADSDAYNFTSSVGKAIRWLKSTQQGLRMGTTAGTITAADAGNAGITPSTPPTITLGVDYAVAPIDAQLIGAYSFFIQANLFLLRQLVYDWTISSDKSEDMTLLADHILRDGGGAIQMARQESPNDRIWIPRPDGQMAILTRNVEQQVFGWVRFIAGATSGGNGTYNSVAIIPVDGADDAVYVAVSRVVNGTPVQFIEMFTPELFQNSWEPCRLDASVSINNPITVTGISVASPGVVTAPSHGLSNGQRIRIDGVVGMTFPGVNPVNNQPVTESINGFPYLVVYINSNTFSLTDEFGTPISTVLYSPYLSGGQVRAMNTTFTGLSYLNGEYVSVVTDSGLPAAQQTFLVAGGQITLPNPAAVVHIGLPYTGTLKLLPLGEAIQGMTTQTKKKKVYKIVARVWQSSGGQFGDNLNNLYKQIYNTQTPDVIPGSSPPLYTGDIGLDFESFFAELWQPILVQQVPLPYMLLALVIDTDTQAGKSE